LKYHFDKNHLNHKNDIKKYLINKSENTITKKPFNEYLLGFIVCGQHSFTTVEEPAFISLIKSIDNNQRVPSADTISNLANKKFEDIKILVKNLLTNNFSKFALTTDIWTSINVIPYACVTAYFIDKNFDLKDLTINFEEMPHPHDGEAIFNIIKSTCVGFNIDNNIITVTTDNASNNISGVKLFKQWLSDNYTLNFSDFHLRCFAHIIT
jgi:hypothetical protein